MHHLFIDIETFSRLDLTRVGTYRYAEDCELLMVAWALDDEPADVSEDARPMFELMERGDVRIVAHNAPFERAGLRHINAPIHRWHCTMAQALAHSLPGGLDALGRFLGLPEDQRKAAAGKALIRLFCRPQRDGSRATAQTHPQEWAQFLDYCRQDVEAMRECFRRMPTVNYPGAGERELRYWHLDQRINDRGFLVDQDLCLGAISACATAKRDLDAAVARITGGELRSATQRDALQRYLTEQCGLSLDNMQSKTLDRAAALATDEDALGLLAARRDVSRSSTAKYGRVLEAVSSDGRLRGSTQFCGASRTGRSTGRIFQPLNLPRPNKAQAERVPLSVAALRCGAADLVLDDVHENAVYALRGVVVAPAGKRLAVADWNAIEGRILSWHAGEHWKVRAFEQGADCYRLTYRRGWGLADDAEVSDDQRQHGKVCLAGDTPVLCDSGWKRLDQVRRGDRVWDGAEWTRHGGLVSKGWKRVVNVCGIWSTPDHLFLCGNHWSPASTLVRSAASICRALESGAASLSSLATSLGAGADFKPSLSSAIAEAMSTQSRAATSSESSRLAAMCARSARRLRSVFSSTRVRAPIPNTDAGCSTGWLRRSTAATTKLIAASRITARAESECATSGATIAGSFFGTFRQFVAGMMRPSTWIESTTAGGTSPGIFSSSAAQLTRAIGELSSRLLPLTRRLRRKCYVYDLSFAGPRNRYTILTANGPMVVHNCDLSLGYEGGVSALLQMVPNYGINVSELGDGAWRGASDEVRERAEWLWEFAQARKMTHDIDHDLYVSLECAKLLWRGAHPATVQFWKDLKAAAMAAIREPGSTHRVRRCSLTFRANMLALRLPSGRMILYASPRIKHEEIEDENGRVRTSEALTYRSPYGGRDYLYGGKLANAATQGLARDIMWAAIERAEAAGFDVVLHVYDEIVAEVDEGGATHEELSALMCAPYEFAPGLPLASEGFTEARYRK